MADIIPLEPFSKTRSESTKPEEKPARRAIAPMGDELDESRKGVADTLNHE